MSYLREGQVTYYYQLEEISVNSGIKDCLILEPKEQRGSNSVPHADVYMTHCVCAGVCFPIKKLNSV